MPLKDLTKGGATSVPEREGGSIDVRGFIRVSLWGVSVLGGEGLVRRITPGRYGY